MPLLWFEIRALFRRRRTFIALMLYAASAASLVFGITYLQGELKTALQDIQVPHSEMSRIFSKLLSKTQYMSSERIDYVLRVVSDWPLSIWLFQLCSLFLMPSLIALMSSDMIAIDVYRRTVRLVLLKCRRTSYYLGKIAAHFLLFSTIQAVSVAVLVVSTHYSGSPHSLWLLLKAGGISLLFFMPFLLICVALTAWISSWCSRPQTALILVHTIWILLLCFTPYFPSFTPFNPVLLVGMLFPLEAEYLSILSYFALWIGGILLFGIAGFIRREV